MLYISCRETTEHPHRFSTMKVGNTQPPHTYTAKAAYAVHFFQRGYSAHPQTLNYEGRKHTATHTYTGATTCAAHFLLYILAARLLCTPTDSGLWRQETHSHPHIYCCSSLRCTFLAGRLLNTPTDSELWRQETHGPPHIYCWSSLRCTFLPARLLYTPTNCELRRQETHSHPHIHWCNSVHYIFFAVRYCAH